MTVLSCIEKPMSRTGRVTGTEVTEERVFLVQSDTPFESGYTLYSSGLIPVYLSVHPTNPYSRMKDFTYSQPDGKLAYTVTVHYDNKPITQDDRNKEFLNPLDRPAKTKWDKRKEVVPMERDVHGNPIVNSAGEYFDPPPEKTETLWMLKVEKNVETRPTWLAEYEDAINDADLVIPGVFTAPKGCAKLVIDDLGDEMEENDITFFVLKYTLEFRKKPDPTNCYDGKDFSTSVTPTGWQMVALNQGLKQLQLTGSPPTLQMENMTDDNGDTLTAPYPLDLSGRKISGDTQEELLDAIRWLVWDQYESKDLSVLPLS
jgi:hypothetical protein